jgi:CubicO group peptidase (beta-lactamase class C family)
MKKLSALLLLLIVFACSPTNDASNSELEARITRIENGLMSNLQIEGEEVPTFNINDRLKELGIPGLSIAVVSNGKIEWARAYGMADSSENRPMTTETMLLAGSISKPVAALRSHQMVESGQLNLDANVNDYLTSWQLPDNKFTAKEKVTLRRILNHTAGLTTWGFPGYDKGDEIPSVPDVLDGKGNTDAVRVYKEPGESWMYSGGGYTIMQLMVTDVEGISFPKIMQQHVLDPLGMQKSTFENPLPEKYHSIAATGYRGDGSEVEGKWPIYPEMAAAGLWTTPSQLIEYAIEIQKINNTKKDGILKYETVSEMLTPGMNGHGLGPAASELTFGHGGADEGFRAQLTAWKNEPHAVVIMVNSDNGKIMREVMLSIAEEYDLASVEPEVKKVISLSEEELQKYIGKFQVGDIGVLEIKILDGHLIWEAEFIDQTIHLAAESETSFFDRNDGTEIEYDILDGKVTGFTVQRIKALRIN